MIDRWGRVDTTIASAGTGKTTRIVGLMAGAIQDGMEPERILGTTFTVKAADELLQRARSHLANGGQLEEANRLLGARMGTVNSVCGRLLHEFAFDLGRSPLTDVIPEDAQQGVFDTAIAPIIKKHASRMLELSDRFGFQERKDDWRLSVHSIVSAARSNGIDAASLISSAEQSIRGLHEVLPLPKAGETSSSLDETLHRCIDAATGALAGVELKKTSQKAAENLSRAAATLRQGRALSWPTWARLAKPQSAKADEDYFTAVATAASAHPRHPRLRQDLTNVVMGMFECAAEALSAFQGYKAERGLVDFVDQEALALEVLSRADTLGRLQERIGLVFVDEVQDSSPLQIAIFSALARIAPKSVWVGDPKQSIYGFRGTDAVLTLAASRSGFHRYPLEVLAQPPGDCVIRE